MKKRILHIFTIVLITLLLVCATAFLVSAEDATAPAVSIDKFNLVFEDNVYLKYAVRFDGVNDEIITSENIGMLFFSAPSKSYTAGNEDFSSSVVGFTTIDEQKYYTFEYRHISAKQMTDYIYSVAYIEVDGVMYYSTPNKFSVLEYCYSKLGKTGEASTNEDYRNLLTATLEQGAMAQKYFKYNTDRLANADYYQIKLENGALLDSTASGLYLPGDKVVLTAPETDSKGHIFSRWENNQGERVGTTAVYELTVGTKNEVYTPIYEHSVVITDAVDPTCTVTGLTEGKHCSVCNEILVAQDVIPANGHTEVIDKAVEPTCAQTGLTQGKHCSVCNQTLVAQELIAAKEHTEVIDKAVAPNCQSTGLTEGKHCSVCNEILVPQEVVKTSSHAYGNSNQCSVCNYIDTECFTFSLLSDNTYSIKATDTNNLPKHIVIPSEYNGKVVVMIHASAFARQNGLISVVIPDSITSIGSGAFQYCNKLTSVVIPDSVIDIGNYAFHACSSLTSIEIGNSVTTIGEYAFYDCTSLTIVVIPDSVTSILRSAFLDCSNLVDVVIGSNVSFIDFGVFHRCGNIARVFYHGDKTSWKKIMIDTSNNYLLDARRYYYSQNAPTTSGNYWHYDKNGNFVTW